MSPRPYRLGQREGAVEAPRTRILDAARNLLASDADIGSITVDMVAQHAGVARMTVYYPRSAALIEDVREKARKLKAAGKHHPSLPATARERTSCPGRAWRQRECRP